jgi:transposase
MLRFPDAAPIYLRPGNTDLRKSINGLSAIVQQAMNKDPFEGGYFVFCNKSRHLLKIIYWDKSGFALWYKRLEKAKFPWPKSKQEYESISKEQIGWLLDGIDFFKVHETLSYRSLGG